MPITPRRALASLAATAVLAAGLTLAGAVSAQAATVVVHNTSELQAALTDGSADTIVVANSFSSVTMSVSQNDTLDLNGFLVSTDHVAVAAGVTFTIESSAAGGELLANAVNTGDAGISATLGTVTILSGEVDAIGEGGGAGIGGNLGANGGTLNISGGIVKASGVAGGAGIGGGVGANGATVNITGGAVTAKGDDGGAGIGGGRSSAGVGAQAGSITISGGTVTAIASLLVNPLAGGGAGIGGGRWDGPGTTTTGGTVVINGTADVTATGTYNSTLAGSGIGGGGNGGGGSITIGGSADVTAYCLSSGAGSVGGILSSFGTVAVDGASHLHAQGVTIIPTGVTITGTGTISGNVYWDNHGSIQPTVDLTGFSVTTNNFPVTFDQNYVGAPAATVVPVYATTMTAGARSIPAAPTRAGFVFTGWNALANGTGAAFTTSTVLSAATTVYAQWVPALVVTTAASVVVDEPISVDVKQGSTTVTPGVTLTTNDPLVSNPVNFPLALFTAGTITITATLNSNHAVTGSTTILVTPGPVESLTLTPSATTVNQGGTITVNATGFDAYGNSVGNVTPSIVLSSSFASDQISGNSVTFPHASPHTITATLRAVSASFLVTVVPAASSASPLATTGVDPSLPIAVAIVLLLLGGLALAVRVVRMRRGSSRTH